MCGIVGRVGRDDAVPVLLSGLANLEYRGYDSAGLAVQNGTGIAVEKRAGEVSALAGALDDAAPTGEVGIGHTRWSTHGPPTDRNAHPHTDSAGRVAVVHNGVIENHDALRDRLEADGRTFRSDTDTEVVPHLVDAALDDGADPATAVRRAVRELDGSYAIAVLIDGIDAVYAVRQGSPLVLGVADEGYFLASDVPAFLEHTDRVVYLRDGDVAVVTPDDYVLTDPDGAPVSRPVETIEWDPKETGKGAYDHFMLKEIHGQPTSLADTIGGRIGDGEVSLDGFPPGSFADASEVHLVGCGTSYHAALYGARLLARHGVRAQAILGSEYGDGVAPVADGTLVVAVTQSGETADTLGAIRVANRRGARTLALTNVVGSTATRAADDTLLLRAGPEIGVAATKTFSSQTVALALLAHRLAEDAPGVTPAAGSDRLLRALRTFPEDVATVLAESRAPAVARHYVGSDAFFFVGRGLDYPVALEGALKFKEITYEHAEGYPAGELKHGPLALVTPKTAVVAVFGPGDDGRTLTTAEEVQSRGADVVAVAPDGHPATEVADAHLTVPETHPALAGLLGNVQLQLLSYHAANRLGRPIDKPRNLAKSVTVE